jgi:hypothetical protein
VSLQAICVQDVEDVDFVEEVALLRNVKNPVEVHRIVEARNAVGMARGARPQALARPRNPERAIGSSCDRVVIPFHAGPLYPPAGVEPGRPDVVEIDKHVAVRTEIRSIENSATRIASPQAESRVREQASPIDSPRVNDIATLVEKPKLRFQTALSRPRRRDECQAGLDLCSVLNLHPLPIVHASPKQGRLRRQGAGPRRDLL